MDDFGDIVPTSRNQGFDNNISCQDSGCWADHLGALILFVNYCGAAFARKPWSCFGLFALWWDIFRSSVLAQFG